MTIQPEESKKFPPLSCSNYAINFLCLIFFFVALFSFHKILPGIKIEHLTLLSLLSMAIPLWLYDLLYLRVYRRPSTGLVEQRGPVNRERLVIKLIGLSGTFLIILVLYHVIPIFRHHFYRSFFDSLKLLMPAIVVFSFIYFREIDRRQKDPYDEYWHMGCLLTGRFKQVKYLIIKEHALNWFIKAFFTPHLFGFLVVNINEVVPMNWGTPVESFLSFHAFLIFLFYAIDIIYGVLGYILTFRVLDTHIRSTEPTVLGWMVCLMCYYPFSPHFGIGLLKYDDGFVWNQWFTFTPLFYYFYGVTIIFLVGVYALATVAIGYRMSNLTFRGLITSGPYRYSKHPAYLGKIASWWLISVPFFAVEGPVVALKRCLLLGVVSIIYYLRAKTEENHLSNYPEYVEYAQWINENGVFRLVAKYFPALKYSEERSKRWKSIVWFKKLR